MRILSALLVACALAAPAAAAAPASAEPLRPLLDAATSADPSVAQPAIRELRSRGPEALDALLDANRSAVAAIRGGGPAPANWDRVRAAIDGVSGQRDAWASGLYWYTDLDAALAAARASGRPVLSLRLLGRLDEEFSCANSRFFRTALYAHAGIRARMRDGFVLHWSSERPVPRITIDYGDGRKIERTITGNSAHYVLDARGRVVDVIPGLMGPGVFQAELDTIAAQAARVAGLEQRDWVRAQRTYWTGRRNAEVAELAAVTSDAGQPDSAIAAADAPRLELEDEQPDAAAAPEAPAATPEAGPLAGVAVTIAVTKSIVETPLLKALDLATFPALDATGDPLLVAASARFADASRLDDGGLAMLRRHVETGADVDRTRVRFEQSMALDTARNRYVVHPRILDLLLEAPLRPFEALNRTVYATVFLTPANDPWLGLREDEVYTGLEPSAVSTAAPATVALPGN